jgi:DNA polymerase I-like protein with 3'-5' exonuclease and polymerase domains
MDDELFRAAYSHYCQSTVADVILIGLKKLDDAGKEVLLQVHDELVTQAPIANVASTAALVREAMEYPLTFPGVDEPLTIPVEIKVGPDWYNMKPLEMWLKENPA